MHFYHQIKILLFTWALNFFIKVPNNGDPEVEVQCQIGGNFSAAEWPSPPGCVNTCENFPKFVGEYAVKFPFNPISTEPVLANREREFRCKNSARIPLFENNSTGPFMMKCQENGKFQVNFVFYSFFNFIEYKKILGFMNFRSIILIIGRRTVCMARWSRHYNGSRWSELGMASVYDWMCWIPRAKELSSNRWRASVAYQYDWNVERICLLN